jgi:hypothetical protein
MTFPTYKEFILSGNKFKGGAKYINKFDKYKCAVINSTETQNEITWSQCQRYRINQSPFCQYHSDNFNYNLHVIPEYMEKIDDELFFDKLQVLRNEAASKPPISIQPQPTLQVPSIPPKIAEAAVAAASAPQAILQTSVEAIAQASQIPEQVVAQTVGAVGSAIQTVAQVIDQAGVASATAVPPVQGWGGEEQLPNIRIPPIDTQPPEDLSDLLETLNTTRLKLLEAKQEQENFLLQYEEDVIKFNALQEEKNKLSILVDALNKKIKELENEDSLSRKEEEMKKLNDEYLKLQLQTKEYEDKFKNLQDNINIGKDKVLSKDIFCDFFYKYIDLRMPEDGNCGEDAVQDAGQSQIYNRIASSVSGAYGYLGNVPGTLYRGPAAIYNRIKENFKNPLRRFYQNEPQPVVIPVNAGVAAAQGMPPQVNRVARDGNFWKYVGQNRNPDRSKCNLTVTDKSGNSRYCLRPLSKSNPQSGLCEQHRKEIKMDLGGGFEPNDNEFMGGKDSIQIDQISEDALFYNLLK